MIIAKYFRFFLKGIGLFLLLDIAVLIYLNNSYLKDSTAFSITKLTASSPKLAAAKTAVPAGASALQVSHDGEYLAYLSGGTVHIAELAGGRTIAVPSASRKRVSSFKWIYDRDRLLIAEISLAGAPYYGKLYYYDMASPGLVEIRDNYYNKDIKFSLSGGGDSITEIDMSAETNLTFLNVNSGAKRNRLWESNIMVSTNPLLGTVTRNIGKFACLKRTDTLFYEDDANGEVYRYGSRLPLRAEGHTELKILGVDENDNLYLASVSGGTVRSIYYGSPAAGNWRRLAVAAAAPVSEFYLAYPGTVLENLPAGSCLVNLATKARSNYSGVLAGVFDTGFLSETGGQVSAGTFQTV